MGINDVIEETTKMKSQWAEYVARQAKDRWAQKTTERRPRQTKRNVGTLPKRRVDKIGNVAGKRWLNIAQDREK